MDDIFDQINSVVSGDDKPLRQIPTYALVQELYNRRISTDTIRELYDEIEEVLRVEEAKSWVGHKYDPEDAEADDL